MCPQERGQAFSAVYTGESGDSGYVRTGQHKSCVERRDQGNAFSKHLTEFHPDREGDINTFKFEVTKIFKQPMVRQIWEAVAIHNSEASLVLNSKAEWEQPVVDRVVVTRELPDRQHVRRGRVGGRGGS